MNLFGQLELVKYQQKMNLRKTTIYIKKVLKEIFLKKKVPQFFMEDQLMEIMLKCLKKLKKLMVF